MSNKRNTKGLLLIISSPSGGGKSTLIKTLVNDTETIVFSVSVTTRERRNGEEEGKDYFFLSKDEFKKRESEGCFIESAEVFGNYYGTPKDYICSQNEKGFDVILDIDVQGVLQVLDKNIDAVTIFLLPPSPSELKKRLVKRGRDRPEEIEKRLDEACSEIKHAHRYQYIVQSETQEKSVNQILSIIESEHLKVQNSNELCENILKEYQDERKKE